VSATIIPFDKAWRERMTSQRTGTSLCGWCLGPPGARRPHKFGIPVANCPCGCHRKPRRVETKDILDRFVEGGGDAAA